MKNKPRITDVGFTASDRMYVILDGCGDFSLRKTFDCGQTFRFEEIPCREAPDAVSVFGNAFGRWISSYALLSYAVYFVHIMLINFWRDLLSESLAHVYYQIPIITLCSFLSSYAVVWILSKLPKAKVWLGS